MVRGPIRIASFFWSSVNAGMRLLQRRGHFPPVELGTRVVSVGNLQAGGSGKTPLVAKIAREAEERGQSVCILSRGYGGIWESMGGVIAPGESVCDPFESGDEPALLHELAPRAWIGVGRDRVASFGRVREQAGALPDLVILDDGFQHWRIRKEVEVLALTSASVSDRMHRDFAGAARGAQLKVWTKGDSLPSGIGDRFVRTRMVPRVLHGEWMARGKLWLVTGLGDPGSALDSIRAEGFLVDRHVSFPDHARYSEDLIRGIEAEARAAGAALAVTGKDWVKLRALGFEQERVVVFEPEVEFAEGGELWNRVLWDSSS